MDDRASPLGNMMFRLRPQIVIRSIGDQWAAVKEVAPLFRTMIDRGAFLAPSDIARYPQLWRHLDIYELSVIPTLMWKFKLEDLAEGSVHQESLLIKL